MYTIAIENMAEIYDSFINVRENSKLTDAMFDYFLKATGKSESLKTGNRPVSKTFFIDDIPLPNPFSSMMTKFESNGLEYTGKISFGSQKGNETKISENFYRNMAQKIQNNENILLCGDSFVFKADKLPLFLIAKNPFGIKIVLGESGTARRTLTNYEQFSTDMKNLESIANLVLDSFIEEKIEMVCPIYLIK